MSRERIISRMTIRYNESNIPTPEQRRLAVEACVIAACADSPKSHHEIRKFVQEQSGFEWVPIPLVSEVANKLCHERRLVRVWREMRSIVSFALPAHPDLPFVKTELKSSKAEPIAPSPSEREMKIIARCEWPKVFHIPSKEDLRPSAKMRTGYDVRVDMNRF